MSKPGSSSFARARLRTNRSAVTRSTSATAICPTTSTLRSDQTTAGHACLLPLERGHLRAPGRLQRWREGTEHRRHQREQERIQQQPSVERRVNLQGNAEAAARGARASPVSTFISTSPASVPKSAIHNPSVRSCCTSRRRLAPSATRTAISRFCAFARDSSRPGDVRAGDGQNQADGNQQHGEEDADGLEIAELLCRTDRSEYQMSPNFLPLDSGDTSCCPAAESAARPAATLWPSRRRPTSCTAATGPVESKSGISIRLSGRYTSGASPNPAIDRESAGSTPNTV